MTNVNKDGNDKEQVVSFRVSNRMLERLQRVAASKGLKPGEFCRLETMRGIDRIEKSAGG